MKVGDIVASKDPCYILHSGSEIYPSAVVIQENPLVLVSEEADMRWFYTIQPDKLKVIGRTDEATLNRCMYRLVG